jgi:hypothetical protein
MQTILLIAIGVIFAVVKLILFKSDCRYRRQKAELRDKIEAIHEGIVTAKKYEDLNEYSITIESEAIEYVCGNCVKVVNPQKTFAVSEYTYFSYKIGDIFDSHDFVTANHMSQTKSYSRV